MKMKHRVTTYLMAIVLGIVFFGSANMAAAGMVDPGCTNNDTNAKLKSGDYQKKTDNFLILQDASSSMFENLNDTTKLNYSKGLLNCLNNSLPDNFDVNGGLRGFGFVTADKGLVYGMTQYSNAGLADGIKAITNTGGVTPIGKAINYGSMDIKGVSSQTAVILFSDGLNTAGPDPVAAAAAMKEMYGDNVCIYTVQIGDDPMGQETMEQIAAASKCGFAVNGSAIADAAGMDQFVMDVFFTQAVKATPIRSAEPISIRPAEPISMTLYIEFDFDKSVVRPEHHVDAKKIADALNKYPGASAHMEGHTDSMGSDAYNMKLSDRRAASVKSYLVEKFNIDAAKISTVGYGESKPVATNDTAAGRQKNRRVVATIQ